MSTAWIIASGKGGVGKSTITTNVGLAMAQEGKKVCIVDGDIGLRDLDILLGLENRIAFDMLDVAEGTCTLEQALISPLDFPSLSLLPASQFARAKTLKPDVFRRIIVRLKMLFDVVLIDCPAGIEQGFMNAIAGADRALVVTMPEVSAIRDADRIIGLEEANEKKRADLVVNRLRMDMVKKGEMM